MVAVVEVFEQKDTCYKGGHNGAGVSLSSLRADSWSFQFVVDSWPRIQEASLRGW